MPSMLKKILADKRLMCYSLLFALLLFVSIVGGYDFSHNKSCFTVSVISVLIGIFCAGIAFLCALVLLRSDMTSGGFADSEMPRVSFKRFVAIFGVILLAWVPYYLACFPGLYVYDAVTQVYYSLGVGVINSFHPLIHTYWLASLLALGNYLFGSYTAGFALYTLSQVLVMSACFSFVLNSLWQICHKRWVWLVSLVLICLFPVFPVLAISATKDAAFSAIFSVFVVQVAKLCRFDTLFTKSKIDTTVLFASALLSGLFRNNAMYVILLVLLVLILKYRHAKLFKQAVLIPCLVSIVLLGMLMPKVISQIQSDSGEILGLPIQQVARTMNFEFDSLSDDEKSKIASLIPSWAQYNERIADPVKFSDGTSQIISDNEISFIQLWFKLSTSYPADYVDAFVAQTEGFWYLFSNYDTLGTTKPYLEINQWEVIGPCTIGRDMGEAGYDAYNAPDLENWIIPSRHSLLPGFLPVVQGLCYSPFWMGSCVSRAITSPSLTIWGSILLVLASLYKRDRRQMLPSIVILAYAVTCLLGPCYLVRYAFPFYACAPIVLGMLSYVLDGTECTRRLR